ncbi:hypothetical protein [Vibrio sp. CyArs1]|uniref:hypothetical protein n=1 Tax=Vibrio sp. CyArs1 TaxID=2682577 RepID=UPI001F0529FF|nr:hypothetical protein [Vibrio sp. CyArs1]
MVDKAKLLATISKSESSAALRQPNEESLDGIQGTKSKLLRTVPAKYFEAHKRAKAKGVTSLDFSGYIYEAIREKLVRDGAL